MKIYDIVKVAWMHIAESRLRMGLCTGAVSIGVLSMLLIASAGMYGQQMLQNGIAALGISGLTVYREQSSGSDRFTTQTAEDLEHTITGVQAAMAVKSQVGSYKAGHEEGAAVFFGVNEKLPQVVQLDLLAGKMLTKQQIKDRKQVVVIDDALAEKAFGRVNAVGKQIRLTIGGVDGYYEIVGVVSNQSAILTGVAAGMIPSIVYLPYTCLADQNTNADLILVQCFSQNEQQAVGERVKTLLEYKQSAENGIVVQDMNSLLGKIERMAESGVLLFTGIAAVAFFVAMFGVLSGMLSAAREKRREIGIYMAIGASRKNILSIFLLQAMIVCALGGACGIGAAWGVLTIIRYSTIFQTDINGTFAWILLGCSTVCGAVAGLIPAMLAARMDPVDAMKG